MDAGFFFNSILLGTGLAMDAFSVSCANALREPKMRLPRMSLIAGVYCSFQFAMPLIGWLCVHTLEERFSIIQRYIPWIAFVLLSWIGGKMFLEGIREQRTYAGTQRAQPGTKYAGMKETHSGTGSAGTQREAAGQDMRAAFRNAETGARLTFAMLFLQGIATSIDALSVGFAIYDYSWYMAILSCLIIGTVTFLICMGGLAIGKKAGEKLSAEAGILGGVILISIGIVNLIH